MLDRSSQDSSTLVRNIVPSFLGWQSYWRAVANLLIFGFAALGCEWLVHQVQYLILYGSRFNAVMAGGPHRLYMAPVGLILLVGAAAFVTLLIAVLSQAGNRRKSLLLRLPARLHPHIVTRSFELRLPVVLLTAIALATLQMLLYFAQENVESVTVTGAWPGLSVFLAAGHLTVIPLHLLAAASSSVLLWAICGVLRRSRTSIQIARVLVAMLDRRMAASLRLFMLFRWLPSLRPRAGELGLRSPPLGLLSHTG